MDFCVQNVYLETGKSHTFPGSNIILSLAHEHIPPNPDVMTKTSCDPLILMPGKMIREFLCWSACLVLLECWILSPASEPPPKQTSKTQPPPNLCEYFLPSGCYRIPIINTEGAV